MLALQLVNENTVSRRWRCPASYALVLAALSMLTGCGAQTATPSAVSNSTVTASDNADETAARLATLMCERLAVMHDVARYKWNRKLPIHDPAREAELLSRLVEEASRLAIPDVPARRFLLAQIEAAKLVQQADHDRWAQEAPASIENTPDLPTELRPRIDALTGALLSEFAKFIRHRAESNGASDHPARELLESLDRELADCLPADVPAAVRDVLLQGLDFR